MKKIISVDENNIIYITYVLKSTQDLKHIIPKNREILPKEVDKDIDPLIPLEAWNYNRDTQSLEVNKEVLRNVKLREVRSKRDKLLQESDVLVIKAVEEGLDLTAIKEYRQKLRDITEVELEDIENIVFPTLPTL